MFIIILEGGLMVDDDDVKNSETPDDITGEEQDDLDYTQVLKQFDIDKDVETDSEETKPEGILQEAEAVKTHESESSEPEKDFDLGDFLGLNDEKTGEAADKTEESKE